MEEAILWHIPYQRNPFFTGQAEIVSQLHQALQTENRIALSHPLGLSGLGGIGKTQLALEYAYRYREDYQALFWVSADSVSSLTTGFQAIAHRLQLPERDEQDQHIIIEAVLRWLRLHSHWLLIFDNLDIVGQITPFLPQAGQGHLLFTTRAQSLGNLAIRLDVTSMEPEVGDFLLLRRSGILSLTQSLEEAQSDEYDAASAISQELDGLPLALDQAGAYIAQYRHETSASGPESLQMYLHQYQERRQEFLATRSKQPEQEYPDSVATTWSLSFRKVSLASPIAANLLRFCAFLAPDMIPEEIFACGDELLGESLFPMVTDPLLLDSAIATLRAYSLLTRQADKATFSIHRLVQAVLQDSLEPAPRYAEMERVVEVMNHIFPSGEFITWQTCERLLTHALKGADWITQERMISPAAVRLLNQAGYYLAGRARFSEAEPLYRRALAIVELPGYDQSELAIIENNLALLLQDQGNYGEAERWARLSLALREQHLGKQHLVTAQSLNNLGSIVEALGKYEEAEGYYRNALAIREQEETSPVETASSLTNLAHLLHIQGRNTEAEPLYKQSLAVFEQHMGKDHPQTASVVNHLGYFYKEKGDYLLAEQFYQRALSIKERTLGEFHPETMHSLNNLATLYKEQNNYAQAQALYRRALVAREHYAGPEHPDTALLLNNLADLLQHQGNYPEAEEICHQALAIRERLLGSEHASTVKTINNLALLCEKQGRYDEAEQWYQRALTLASQPGQPPEARVRGLNNLGIFYRMLQRSAEAEPLLLEAWDFYKQIQGPDHPAAAAVLNNLGLLYADQKKLGEAEAAFTQALNIWELHLGAIHLDIATCLSNLATVYEMQERYAATEEACLRTLSIRQQLLDTDHPDLAYSYNNLAYFYQNQGRYQEAIPLYREALRIFEHKLGSAHPSTQTVFSNLMSLIQALAHLTASDQQSV